MGQWHGTAVTNTQDVVEYTARSLEDLRVMKSVLFCVSIVLGMAGFGMSIETEHDYCEPVREGRRTARA